VLNKLLGFGAVRAVEDIHSGGFGFLLLATLAGSEREKTQDKHENCKVAHGKKFSGSTFISMQR
jgi:hypothetical protein